MIHNKESDLGALETAHSSDKQNDSSSLASNPVIMTVPNPKRGMPANFLNAIGGDDISKNDDTFRNVNADSVIPNGSVLPDAYFCSGQATFNDDILRNAKGFDLSSSNPFVDVEHPTDNLSSTLLGVDKDSNSIRVALEPNSVESGKNMDHRPLDLSGLGMPAASSIVRPASTPANSSSVWFPLQEQNQSQTRVFSNVPGSVVGLNSASPSLTAHNPSTGFSESNECYPLAPGNIHQQTNSAVSQVIGEPTTNSDINSTTLKAPAPQHSRAYLLNHSLAGEYNVQTKLSYADNAQSSMVSQELLSTLSLNGDAQSSTILSGFEFSDTADKQRQNRLFGDTKSMTCDLGSSANRSSTENGNNLSLGQLLHGPSFGGTASAPPLQQFRIDNHHNESSSLYSAISGEENVHVRIDQQLLQQQHYSPNLSSQQIPLSSKQVSNYNSNTNQQQQHRQQQNQLQQLPPSLLSNQHHRAQSLFFDEPHIGQQNNLYVRSTLADVGTMRKQHSVSPPPPLISAATNYPQDNSGIAGVSNNSSSAVHNKQHQQAHASMHGKSNLQPTRSTLARQQQSSSSSSTAAGNAVGVETTVVRSCEQILSGAAEHSLKAVELANTLRARVGTEVLARVRERWGGLLSLLEQHTQLFRVDRIPKNDKVTLLVAGVARLSNKSAIPGVQVQQTQLMRQHQRRPQSAQPLTSNAWALEGGNRQSILPQQQQQQQQISNGVNGIHSQPSLLAGHAPCNGGPVTSSVLHGIPRPRSVPPEESSSSLSTWTNGKFSGYDRLQGVGGDGKVLLSAETGATNNVDVKSPSSKQIVNGDGDDGSGSNDEQGITQTASPTLSSVATTAAATATRCLHVGNVPTNMSEGQLTREFEQFGPLAGLKLVSQRNGNRRFAFVTYFTVEHAMAARHGLSKVHPWKSAISFAHKEFSGNAGNYNNVSNQQDLHLTGGSVRPHSPVPAQQQRPYTDQIHQQQPHYPLKNSPEIQEHRQLPSSQLRTKDEPSFSGDIKAPYHSHCNSSDNSAAKLIDGSDFFQSRMSAAQKVDNDTVSINSTMNNSTGNQTPLTQLPPQPQQQSDCPVLHRLCDDTYVPTQPWPVDVTRDAPYCNAVVAQLAQFGGHTTVSKLRGFLRNRVAAVDNIKSVPLKAMLTAYSQLFTLDGNYVALVGMVSTVHHGSGGANTTSTSSVVRLQP